ncbi:MAG TPA: hypothetical protein VGK99_18230 [Acidobacteriota bacterium]|jgi:hypothetical protein
MLTESVVLGSGSHVYEVIEQWGTMPEGVKYGYTHGVVVDSQDRIFVFNQSKDAVIIFDSEGSFVKSWGPLFQHGAHGMFLNRERDREYLYLTDYVRHVVVRTTLDGEICWTLDAPPLKEVYKKAEDYQPTNVALAPNGDFYVADGYGQTASGDRENHGGWIHQYNSDANYIRSWGGKGSGPGRLNGPHGIWVDTRGATPVVVVADRSNHRIQTFTLGGSHIGFVYEGLRFPCHFDQRGDELLVPDLHGQVTILDRNYKPIVHLGDNPGVWERSDWPNIPPEERKSGAFISPHAACWDSQGNIYVVEWISDGRVTKLRRIN